MICRQCGTEIAAKALICYRCGTATTEPQFRPAARKPSSSLSLILTMIALALVIVSLYLGRASAGETSRLFSWIVIAVAVVVVGLRAYARRH
jgi:ABC-type transport system involved in cytochrome c biogenesis permease subunit